MRLICSRSDSKRKRSSFACPACELISFKLIDNDILPILQGDGLVFLTIPLELLFRFFQPLFQTGGLCEEKFIRCPRKAGILFVAL